MTRAEFINFIYNIGIPDKYNETCMSCKRNDLWVIRNIVEPHIRYKKGRRIWCGFYKLPRYKR